MRRYLMIAMLFVLITACKKKEDAKTVEDTAPVAVVPAGNATTTPTPTTPPSPTTIPSSTVIPQTIDYRDSITGTYSVTFAVTYKQNTQIVIDHHVVVRKPKAGERPDLLKNMTPDSCITVESISMSDGAPYKTLLTVPLRPDFSYSGVDHELKLASKTFYYWKGCCGCGSAGCFSSGSGNKLP